MKKTALFLLCSMLTIFSCSTGNNLSKEDAEKIIFQNLKTEIFAPLQIGKTVNQNTGSFRPFLLDNPTKISNEASEDYSYFLMEKKGLIVLNKTKDSTGGKSYYIVNLTKEGEKFLSKYANEVGAKWTAWLIAANLDTIEITEMSENFKKDGFLYKTIFFKKHYRLSPFGEIFVKDYPADKNHSGVRKRLNDQHVYEMSLVKHDNGWAIEQ